MFLVELAKKLRMTIEIGKQIRGCTVGVKAERKVKGEGVMIRGIQSESRYMLLCFLSFVREGSVSRPFEAKAKANPSNCTALQLFL